jgi:hypothetical protein
MAANPFTRRDVSAQPEMPTKENQAAPDLKYFTRK